MNFGEAIAALKEGKYVRRIDWDEKYTYIYLDEYFATSVPNSSIRPKKRYDSIICMWTTKLIAQPGWTPTQEDMLEDDWVVIEEDY